MVVTQEPAHRGARARTRAAIVDAAFAQLALDPSATLGTIADAAGVGRTTLHRYFPERSDLLDALLEHAGHRLEEATRCARPEDGTARSAVVRLSQEYLELGDLLTVIFSGTIDATCIPDPDGQDPILALVRKGHADGSIDPELTDDWVLGIVWSQLYNAWEILRGRQVSRHDVVRQLVRTIDKAIAA
ncbi:TetR/AcrR family transcriptional regulator [Isoptericola halotolerans]|uniref:AcrR family transcriptional regulator n=1 Tax=Isoptericola halotolerans TaxID=300560 RepID=A0ABX2A725_9MICO|nr:TetR/AcrR family transcriptional regulator [Isoptericola halotolerans]NOV98396.1 AcrR family transcriptional regulator [Isoptericola halotolerans]